MAEHGPQLWPDPLTRSETEQALLELILDVEERLGRLWDRLAGLGPAE